MQLDFQEKIYEKFEIHDKQKNALHVANTWEKRDLKSVTTKFLGRIAWKGPNDE